MTKKKTIDIINEIYDKEGFNGVITEVEDRLKYGTIKKINGLYRITTGGWSEDEMLLHLLISMICKFNKHYCGYICGGAFYFSEEKYAKVEMIKPDDLVIDMFDKRIERLEKDLDATVKVGMPTGALYSDIELLEELKEEFLK